MRLHDVLFWPFIAFLSALLWVLFSAALAYDRDDYKHWTDHDDDCQNARHEVLIRDSVDAITLSEDGCKVISGIWLDPYSDEVWTDPKVLDVDHFVPLANADRSGASEWSSERKEAYANELHALDHLVATHRKYNRSKGAKGPEDWLPPKNQCWYVARWLEIKDRWDLTLTAAEAAAIVETIIDNRCWEPKGSASIIQHLFFAEMERF